MNNSGNASLFLVDNVTGNVGIGTASPGQKLDIQGGNVILTSTGVVHPMTGLAPANAFLKFEPESATYGKGSITGFSDDAGRTGLLLRGMIGNSNPTDTTPALQLMGGKSNGGTDWAGMGADEIAIALDSNGGGAGELVVMGSGNVGIGTTSPSGLLNVNGTGTLLNVSGGDVVFEI